MVLEGPICDPKPAFQAADPIGSSWPKVAFRRPKCSGAVSVIFSRMPAGSVTSRPEGTPEGVDPDLDIGLGMSEVEGDKRTLVATAWTELPGQAAGRNGIRIGGVK